ncbi:hypothetical protein GCM10022405_43660 [Gibbsiella dentisursi]|uniref:Uncharacterized protein n=1 Tax=Gibbsiella dentisursi TaxID=796890 RepID=A0ABP7M490_9GAMM
MVHAREELAKANAEVAAQRSIIFGRADSPGAEMLASLSGLCGAVGSSGHMILPLMNQASGR